ncbi:sulfatase family protein [Olivibacter domesticus]|uniref:Arylsulfatase A n=1 Tax=Olivibacter domesticus TaxID=407022 RepID=A0A1H7QXS1_OLID1|nr:sulfatase [Olivibacter domesticus]SEL52518.1 Arylsulfatase A [Olivibacter domesticus]
MNKYIAALFFFVTGICSLWAQETPQRPNIIWITCEDISPFISAYGDRVVKTPNIDQLAAEGVRFTKMYTTAGVCAPSRSSIITGMYPIAIGTQHMRTRAISAQYIRKGIPNYSAVIPAYVKCFPEYLREVGYYTTNNEKQDYQFDAPVTVWDENGATASYENRSGEQPFFSIYNFFATHESQLFSRKDSLLVDPASVYVPPFYKDTPTTRRDIARLLSNIQLMDKQVGELITKLKADRVYENSYIFFYSDHGGSLPWMKRELLERGTHIPFIIRFPKGANGGTVDHRLLSSIDFAPTVLSLTGAPIPDYLQGHAFLGQKNGQFAHSYVFSARDRMDELYDRVRAVRDHKFRYVRNLMPQKPSYQDLIYRKSVPMMQEMIKLKEKGELDKYQAAWFKSPKDTEELYDVEKDPNELNNLAADDHYANKLTELRKAMDKWIEDVGDMSELSEKEMVSKWWDGEDHPPITAKPEIIVLKEGIKLSCATEGASIGYRVGKEIEISRKRPILTWDSGFVSGRLKEGTLIDVESPWSVYKGALIKLVKGERLQVQAMRIGFMPNIVEYVKP